MSEREKKEELIIKQRSELRLKKSQDLEPVLELAIQEEVIQQLENDLSSLIMEQQQVRL